jgi:hypothetical protein
VWGFDLWLAGSGAIGVVSDMYPLFGWHKASYINAVGVLGTIAFLVLASVQITAADAAGFLLLLGNLQVFIHTDSYSWSDHDWESNFSFVKIATTDLLMEGQYAGKMAGKPQTGSMMVFVLLFVYDHTIFR